MIEIFGNSACPYCLRAQKLAKRYSLQYEYKNIDYEKYRDELTSLKEDYKTVPQIWWNGKYIGGYNELAAEIENTRNYGQEGF